MVRGARPLIFTLSKMTTHIPQAIGDPNALLSIRKESTELVTPNFQQRELFNPKVGGTEHPLSRQVVVAVQVVRDYFGVPIGINSTYRNYVPTGAGVVDAASKSPHMLAQAVDFRFMADEDQADNIHIAIRDDFASKGPLFRQLWAVGARGFGVYDTFIHLDTVRAGLYPAFAAKRTALHEGEPFAYWNKMKWLRNRKLDDGLLSSIVKGQAGMVAGFLSEAADDEDRGADVTLGHVTNLLALILLPVLSVVGGIFIYKKYFK